MLMPLWSVHLELLPSEPYCLLIMWLSIEAGNLFEVKYQAAHVLRKVHTGRPFPLITILPAKIME